VPESVTVINSPGHWKLNINWPAAYDPEPGLVAPITNTVPVTVVPTCISWSWNVYGTPLRSKKVPLHIPVRPPPVPSVTVTDHIALAVFPQLSVTVTPIVCVPGDVNVCVAMDPEPPKLHMYVYVPPPPVAVAVNDTAVPVVAVEGPMIVTVGFPLNRQHPVSSPAPTNTLNAATILFPPMSPPSSPLSAPRACVRPPGMPVDLTQAV